MLTEKQKPTPGPWTVETIPSDSGGHYITGHITSPLHTYAGNTSPRTRPESITSPDTMTKADAYQMAASPEMREACELFTAAAHEVLDLLSRHGLPWPASIAFAAEKARNAIAKAEDR